jgi:hypothetical protein
MSKFQPYTRETTPRLDEEVRAAGGRVVAEAPLDPSIRAYPASPAREFVKLGDPRPYRSTGESGLAYLRRLVARKGWKERAIVLGARPDRQAKIGVEKYARGFYMETRGGGWLFCGWSADDAADFVWNLRSDPMEPRDAG